MPADNNDVEVIGPDAGPAPPFPLRFSGDVIEGFGRGSKELGIPTANLPVDGLDVAGRDDLESGIYYGWASLNHETVYPMVMSVGWNPFYKNSKRSVEVHLMASFPSDFYGARLALLILAYIRPERDYVSIEGLIADINNDIAVARRSLDRPAYASLKDDAYLLTATPGSEGDGKKAVAKKEKVDEAGG